MHRRTHAMRTPNTPFFEGLFTMNDTCLRARDAFKSALHWVNFRHREVTRRNTTLRGRHRAERCFILGTAPSIGEQDLLALKSEHTIAVNFFHKHPQAAQLRPHYWVIQDKKLWEGGWAQELIGPTGTWPSSMLKDIYTVSPQTELFLPVSGYDHSQLRAATTGHDVHWIANGWTFVPGFAGPVDLASAGLSGNVMQIAVGIAEYLGFEEIYLLGISLDGLLRDLSGRPSHFYSAPPENRHLEFTTIERDLIMSGLGFRSWRALAEYYSGTRIKVVNLTPDGYLDVLPRSTLEEVLRGRR